MFIFNLLVCQRVAQFTIYTHEHVHISNTHALIHLYNHQLTILTYIYIYNTTYIFELCIYVINHICKLLYIIKNTNDHHEINVIYISCASISFENQNVINIVRCEHLIVVVLFRKYININTGMPYRVYMYYCS